MLASWYFKDKASAGSSKRGQKKSNWSGSKGGSVSGSSSMTACHVSHKGQRNLERLADGFIHGWMS